MCLRVRQEAEEHRWRYEVVGGREEGMLLYLRRPHFLSADEAVRQWNAGQLDALVTRNQPVRDWPTLLAGARLQFVSEKATDVAQYSFFVRAGPGSH